MFQQDNTFMHVSRSIKRWFESHQSARLEWPPHSSGYNTIENWWVLLARRVYQENWQHFSTTDASKKAIIPVWNSVDKNTIKNLAHTMPNTVPELAIRQGKVIEY